MEAAHQRKELLLLAEAAHQRRSRCSERSAASSSVGSPTIKRLAQVSEQELLLWWFVCSLSLLLIASASSSDLYNLSIIMAEFQNFVIVKRQIYVKFIL